MKGILILMVAGLFSIGALAQQDSGFTNIVKYYNDYDGFMQQLDSTNAVLRVVEAYKNGKTCGVVKIYYKNGPLSVPVPFYYPTSDKIELQYVNNILKYKTDFSNGGRSWTIGEYYENGKVKNVTSNANGKYGITKYYDEQGNQIINGTQKEYDYYGNVYTETIISNGIVKEDKVYANGKLWFTNFFSDSVHYSRKYYDKNGNEIK